MPVYNEKNKNKWTKDGRHYYFRCHYTDLYGKRKQFCSRMYKTSSEAKNAESEFILKANEEAIITSDDYFNTIVEEWLETYKARVKITTYYPKVLLAKKYIINYFKDVKIKNLNVKIIKAWYDSLPEYTTDYVNRIISLMRDIIEYAKNTYSFDYKIINVLQKKVNCYVEIKEEADLNYWTLEEYRKFISCVDNNLYNTIFSFFYYTGVRKGELFGLIWADIDFNRKTVKLSRQVSNKTGTGKSEIITLKTNNSYREIELPDELIDQLKIHYENEKELYGFTKTWFVFGNVKPISATTLRRQLAKYIKKAGVKKLTAHGFRHSHVSLLINLGCDFKEVADRIGDTPETVQNTYYHLFPEKKSKPVNLLNKLNKNER